MVRKVAAAALVLVAFVAGYVVGQLVMSEAE